MSKGWIKLDRQLSEHWLWKDQPFSYGQAWVDLLLKANHKPAKILIKTKLVEIKRGEQARSEVTLSGDWGWSRGKVRRFLKLLKNDAMIEQKAVQVTSVISICNYDSFQLGGTGDGTVVDTVGGTVVEQEAVHKQECKNDKNVKNVKNNPLAASPPADKKPKYSPEDLKTAEWIFDRILLINPNNKKPNFDSWANHVRLMREVDNKSHSEICEVFNWANKDNFWRSNILGPKKLRDQFDKLSIKMKQVAAPSKALVDQSGFGDDDDFIDSHVIPNQPRYIENG